VTKYRIRLPQKSIKFCFFLGGGEFEIYETDAKLELNPSKIQLPSDLDAASMEAVSVAGPQTCLPWNLNTKLNGAAETPIAPCSEVDMPIDGV
jgi:hypothetical protein